MTDIRKILEKREEFGKTPRYVLIIFDRFDIQNIVWLGWVSQQFRVSERVFSSTALRMHVTWGFYWYFELLRYLFCLYYIHCHFNLLDLLTVT